MKREYEKPMFQVVFFEDADVIKTSLGVEESTTPEVGEDFGDLFW